MVADQAKHPGKVPRIGPRPLPANTVPSDEPFSVAFDVEGIPTTQGSTERKPRKNKAGQTVWVTVHAHEKELWRWRDLVVEKAIPHAPPVPLNGAVRLDLAFWLPVPASAPKRRQIPANTLWDLSKLIRAVEDALTDAGFFPTDGRITDFGPTKKRYAYDRPAGVTITVAETDGLS